MILFIWFIYCFKVVVPQMQIKNATAIQFSPQILSNNINTSTSTKIPSPRQTSVQTFTNTSSPRQTSVQTFTNTSSPRQTSAQTFTNTSSPRQTSAQTFTNTSPTKTTILNQFAESSGLVDPSASVISSITISTILLTSFIIIIIYYILKTPKKPQEIKTWGKYNPGFGGGSPNPLTKITSQPGMSYV